MSPKAGVNVRISAVAGVQSIKQLEDGNGVAVAFMISPALPTVGVVSPQELQVGTGLVDVEVPTVRGVVEQGDDTKDVVEGSCTWYLDSEYSTQINELPTTADDYMLYWVFTPDSANYREVSGEITLTLTEDISGEQPGGDGEVEGNQPDGDGSGSGGQTGDGTTGSGNDTTGGNQTSGSQNGQTSSGNQAGGNQTDGNTNAGGANKDAGSGQNASTGEKLAVSGAVSVTGLLLAALALVGVGLAARRRHN